MQMYNTMGRTLQPFEPRVPGEISMYVCGPTVQAAPHLGHGRQAVAFDVIRRYLAWRGFAVTFVTNITDIEDKIIAAAAQQGISTIEVAERATTQFLEGYRRLGVLPADRLVYATEHIGEMHSTIQVLIDRGHAYPAAGDVYFAVRSFPAYGRLSGRNVDDMEVGSRIEAGDLKRDPLDFALWKAAKEGEPSWDSPWGAGRPGWHIECSAMATKELGFGFDVHGGGLDLVFPHHENEVAQAEAAADAEPFARYWLHNGMLELRGEKMSKSEGNVFGLLEATERWPGEVLRLFFLRAHYRAPLDFGPDLVEDAAIALRRLWAFRRRAGKADVEPDHDVMERFAAGMDEDFATPEALATLFDAVREGNRRLDGGQAVGGLAAAYDQIAGIVLGIAEPAGDISDLGPALAAAGREFGLEVDGVEKMIDALIGLRSAARTDRDFALADRVRDVLTDVGIVLEDGADGTAWHRA